MFVDLYHNYIVKSIITEKFAQSVEKKLLPKLESKYGEAILGIQMYEDYISDAFYARGEWYYPLTVVLSSGPITEWIKWRMKAGSFKDGLPYAFVGEGFLEINIADDVPAEFGEKLSGRAILCTDSGIKINIETTSPDPSFLSGRYSQTFIDEMSRQLCAKISEAMAVSGIAESPLTLSLFFAPDTYMQHTSENVTYRRLLITDGVSAPRDFWVKWTREDGAMAYSVSDHVSGECISFDIGEDVPQKVREKEYRFLLAAGGDKYHNAMGRKNITEWREIIRRAIRRGDLAKIEVAEEGAPCDDITAALAAVLGKEAAPAEAPELQPAEKNAEFERAMAMARQIMEERESEAAETLPEDNTPEEAPAEEEAATEIAFAPAENANASISIFDLDTEAAEDSFEEIDDEEALESFAEEEAENTAELEALDGTEAPEAEEVPAEEPVAVEVPKTETLAELEARLRAELEEKIRREMEEKARAAAEAEAARILAEKEALRLQREELERARAQQEERARLEHEEQLRREAREKERMAEAAKIALAEARREEEARQAAKAEQERKAEAARRAEAERKAAEEKALKEKTNQAIAGNIRTKNYTYTSKTVRLLFRRSVDPNITSRIYEIIKTTLEYYGKEKMYMRIKATIPDTTTVILEFLEIPMEEMTLLSNIIKVLGNSGLGIAKAIVD